MPHQEGNPGHGENPSGKPGLCQRRTPHHSGQTYRSLSQRRAQGSGRHDTERNLLLRPAPAWEEAAGCPVGYFPFHQKQGNIRFSYKRQDGAEKEHTAKPVALLFSEFYFYLVAYKEEETEFPTIFRVDRIGTMGKTGNYFQVPYQDRFKDGEFRKRVQFMYPGVLRRVTFTYSGPSVEAVLDRLPTARILSHKDGIYTLTAEAYGKGLDMWLGSQEKWVKVLQSEEVTS